MSACWVCGRQPDHVHGESFVSFAMCLVKDRWCGVESTSMPVLNWLLYWMEVWYIEEVVLETGPIRSIYGGSLCYYARPYLVWDHRLLGGWRISTFWNEFYRALVGHDKETVLTLFTSNKRWTPTTLVETCSVSQHKISDRFETRWLADVRPSQSQRR